MATVYNNQLSAAEKNLSASAQAGIQAAKDAYNAAKAKGDTAGMKAANEQANAIRNSNNLTTSNTGIDVVAKPTSSTTTVSPTSTGSSGSSGQMTSSWSNAGTGSSQMSYPTTSGGSTGGNYSTGKVVQVAAGGNAPTGTQIGDTVRTAGGDYLVVAPNTPGANYNPTNGLWSIKVSSTGGTAGGSTAGVTAPVQQPYTPKGTYMDAGLSVYDDPKVKALQAYYESRKAAGATQAELNSIHQQAEDIRSAYGYSGGGDGSMYIPIQMPEDTLPEIGLPIYEPQVEQVDSLYNAAQQRALAALQSAYDQSRLELEKYQSSIPGIYQQQANALAAQQAMQQRQYNEYAAQSGLNTGNSAQARLAMANQMQNNLGQIRTAEANATAEAQYQLTQLFTSYQNSIAEALANNEYERAAALLAEYRERAQSVVSVAQNQANLDVTIAGFNRDTNQTNWQKQMALAEAMAAQGDFSGYRALGLSDDQINAMRRGWLAQNPEAAVNLGLASYR